MNTKINYTYRDRGNFHVHNEAIIPGELTAEQQEEILRCCDSKEWFVPSQVGLSEQRFENWTEDDTPFFEVGDPFFELTNEAPTVNITPLLLVIAFQKAENHWACNWYE